MGPQYGLPHAVSGNLPYYLWGPGYSWDVMLIIAGRTNHMPVLFDECELKETLQYDLMGTGRPSIYVYKKPKVPADAIWSSMKIYR
jgi:hypothetical protein